MKGRKYQYAHLMNDFFFFNGTEDHYFYMLKYVLHKKSANEKCLSGDVFVQTRFLTMVRLSTD